MCMSKQRISRQVRAALTIKRKNNYIDCCTMLTEDVGLAKIIIPLHMISGSHHTLSFYGHGNKANPRGGIRPHRPPLPGQFGPCLSFGDIKTDRALALDSIRLLEISSNMMR